MTEMDFKGVPLDKLNHRQKFLYRRKLKRKRQRQTNALKEIEEILSAEDSHGSDEEKERLAESLRQEQERLWLQREEEAQTRFAKLKAEREAEEQRAKANQANANTQPRNLFVERPNDPEKIQEELFRRLRQGIEEVSDPGSLPKFHRPEPPRAATSAAQTPNSGQLGKTPELCGFFWKTGACRYGDRCSRLHPSAPLSESELRALIQKSDLHDPAPPLVLILVNMFAHFALSTESHAPGEDDNDESLEVDEAALLADYCEFYADVYGELTGRWGRILGFRTCCNRSDHLRGSVYVQFAEPTQAYDALRSCQNRWYAGRQVIGRIAYLGCGWKGAVCGLHHRGRCPKGNSECNFLHVFTNPEESPRDLLLALSHNLPQLPPVQENRMRRRGRSNSSDSDQRSDPRDPVSPSQNGRSHDHQRRHHSRNRRHHQRRHRGLSSRSPRSSHGSSPSPKHRHRKKHRRSRS